MINIRRAIILGTCTNLYKYIGIKEQRTNDEISITERITLFAFSFAKILISVIDML